MSRKKKKNEQKKREREEKGSEREEKVSPLHPDTKKSIWIVIFAGLAVIFTLAATGEAGPWGAAFYSLFDKLFGWGYFLLPAVSVLVVFSLLAPDRKKLFRSTLIGGGVFILAALGFIDIVAPGSGGWIGSGVGTLKIPFGVPVALIVTITAMIVSFLVIVNKPLKLTRTQPEEEELPEINLPQEP